MAEATEKLIDYQGAACNVLYLFSCKTESLTGPQAVRRAVSLLFALRPEPTPTKVDFKVSGQGITLTDKTRSLFFRKHFATNDIKFCGLDPECRMWSVPRLDDRPSDNFTIFAFVAKRSPSTDYKQCSTGDNQCHVFCQLEPNQPAAAIVSYVHKVIPNSASVPN